MEGKKKKRMLPDAWISPCCSLEQRCEVYCRLTRTILHSQAGPTAETYCNGQSLKLFLKHCCQFLRQHQWKWGYFNLPFELLQVRTRNLLNISQTESSEPALTTEFTGVVSWTGLKTSPRIIWCLYRKQIALSYLKIYKCDCFIWWFPRKDAQFGLSTYGRLWSFFLVGY